MAIVNKVEESMEPGPGMPCLALINAVMLGKWTLKASDPQMFSQKPLVHLPR